MGFRCGGPTGFTPNHPSPKSNRFLDLRGNPKSQTLLRRRPQSFHSPAPSPHWCPPVVGPATDRVQTLTTPSQSESLPTPFISSYTRNHLPAPECPKSMTPGPRVPPSDDPVPHFPPKCHPRQSGTTVAPECPSRSFPTRRSRFPEWYPRVSPPVETLPKVPFVRVRLRRTDVWTDPVETGHRTTGP